MKILIAEDDATSQLLLQSTLEQWDHEVVVTSDGLQAYQALLADDYLNKPFDRKELQARIQVGKRVLDMQMTLADRERELEEAIAREKHLQGLLPICS